MPEKINLQLKISAAREVYLSLNSIADKLRWVIENRFPKNEKQLRERLFLLEEAISDIGIMLNKIENENKPAKRKIEKSIKKIIQHKQKTNTETDQNEKKTTKKTNHLKIIK